MFSQQKKAEVVSPMNIQEASFRNMVANGTPERLPLDRSAAFLARATAVATVAAAEAADVDLKARFPQAAIDAAREQKLLGMQVPVEFGGFGASMSDVTDVCYTLGRACSSTAMIFARGNLKLYHSEAKPIFAPQSTITGVFERDNASS